MCYSWEDFETGCSPLYRPNRAKDTNSFTSFSDNIKDSNSKVEEDRPKSEEYNYKPLPEYLTIKKSKLHGKGLFIKREYCAHRLADLGITHHILNGKVVRTPLGGWLNDGGKDANCTLIPTNDEGKEVDYGKQAAYSLQVSKLKVENEELTLDYSKWMWILDGSLYPPDYEPYPNHAVDLGRKPPLPSEQIGFYSPYNLEVGINMVDVKSVNMLQDTTFETRLAEFGEKFISNMRPSDIVIPKDIMHSLLFDDYIGAPGGELVQTESYTLQKTLDGSVRLKINNSNFKLEGLCEDMRHNFFYNLSPFSNHWVYLEDSRSAGILSDKINTWDIDPRFVYSLKDLPQHINQYETKITCNGRPYVFRLRSVATAAELAKERVNNLVDNLSQGEERGYWDEIIAKAKQ